MTTEEKEHTSHCEYPVKQDAIEAIGSVLDLLVRLAVSKRHDDERPEDVDKSYGNIQNAPPFWECSGVVRQTSSHGEHRRYEEATTVTKVELQGRRRASFFINIFKLLFCASNFSAANIFEGFFLWNPNLSKSQACKDSTFGRELPNYQSQTCPT